jgi:hypothetical protein
MKATNKIKMWTRDNDYIICGKGRRFWFSNKENAVILSRKTDERYVLATAQKEFQTTDIQHS